MATPPTFIKVRKENGAGKVEKRMGRMNGRKVDELIRAQLPFSFFYLTSFLFFLVWFFAFLFLWLVGHSCLSGFLVDWFDGLFCWFRV